jgi:hypothetical protein
MMVDVCILPGTACGVEIIWLYSKQWHHKTFLFAVALASFAYSHMYTALEHRLTGISNERESTR